MNWGCAAKGGLLLHKCIIPGPPPHPTHASASKSPLLFPATPPPSPPPTSSASPPSPITIFYTQTSARLRSAVSNNMVAELDIAGDGNKGRGEQASFYMSGEGSERRSSGVVCRRGLRRGWRIRGGGGVAVVYTSSVSYLAFVTHCGWSSVLQGVLAGLPLVAWPMMYEQFVNERLIKDVLRVGVRMRKGAKDVAAFEVSWRQL